MILEALHKMLITTAMVLISLAAAAAATGHPNRPVIMPRNLSQLSYPAADGRNRIWTKADLDRAPSVLNYEQMWPVIRRLEAGLPITVLAFGDSITKDHGGCFHRDRCVKSGRQAGSSRYTSSIYSTDALLRYRSSLNAGKCNTHAFTPTHFHISRAHLSQYVDALSMAYWGPCRVGGEGRGWLNNFMQVINATFPHPGVWKVGRGTWTV